MASGRSSALSPLRVFACAMDPVFGFFRTGPDRPPFGDADAIANEYRRRRFLVFWSLVFGYSFFYVCRLTFSVAKKPLIEAGVLNADQMGKIGSAMLLTYAFGKVINGFLADRSHIGRFIASGLFGSAVIIILFGFTHTFYLFVVLWALNGWLQSMGAAPCGASISQWFSNKERGTRYGIWSTAHSLGEGATFLVTAAIIAAWGWQWGFWAAGVAGILVSLLLFQTLADRPPTYGLPKVADFRNDHTEESRGEPLTVRQAQWQVIRNPYMWILGLACAAMYVGRYGVNSWGVLYLQESKGYTLLTAGWLLFLAKMMETMGALSSGFVSDFLFRSRRNVVMLLYGFIQIVGFAILFAGPTTYLGRLDSSVAPELTNGPLKATAVASFEAQSIRIPDNAQLISNSNDKKPSWLLQGEGWLASLRGLRIEQQGAGLGVYRKYDFVHLLGFSLFGFGLGGLLVFLGGLVAIDICPKNASGAAMGFVGLFSYLGASLQDFVSGKLIEAGKMTVDGQITHEFGPAITFWFCAAAFSVMLACSLWRVKARD